MTTMQYKKRLHAHVLSHHYVRSLLVSLLDQLSSHREQALSLRMHEALFCRNAGGPAQMIVSSWTTIHLPH